MSETMDSGFADLELTPCGDMTHIMSGSTLIAIVPDYQIAKKLVELPKLLIQAKASLIQLISLAKGDNNE